MCGALVCLQTMVVVIAHDSAMLVAFVVDVPGTPLDPSTALPVQIFLWADSPERAFVERTSAAIMVLLIFLVLLNLLAIYLRNKLEKKW